jgi:hypothetical protein
LGGGLAGDSTLRGEDEDEVLEGRRRRDEHRMRRYIHTSFFIYLFVVIIPNRMSSLAAFMCAAGLVVWDNHKGQAELIQRLST